MPTRTASPMVNAIMAVSSLWPVRLSTDELGHDGLGVTGRAAVVGQLRQRHAHRAGVGQRRDGQSAADRRGQPFELGRGEAAQNAGQHDRAGDEAYLAFQVPALRTAVDRETLGLPGGDPAVEDVDVAQAGRAQRLLGLCGPLTGATHQHDLVVEVPDDLVAVFAQQIQRDVVGTGDVGGLELARGSDVENPRRRRRAEAIAQVLRIDGGGSGHGDQDPSGRPAVRRPRPSIPPGVC